jgi:hypothetical protein
MPKLKKEAKNEILQKRKAKPPLDKSSQRIKLLYQMQNMLVSKRTFVPVTIERKGSKGDINRFFQEAQSTLEKCSVSPIVKC